MTLPARERARWALRNAAAALVVVVGVALALLVVVIAAGIAQPVPGAPAIVNVVCGVVGVLLAVIACSLLVATALLATVVAGPTLAERAERHRILEGLRHGPRHADAAAPRATAPSSSRPELSRRLTFPPDRPQR